MDAEQSLSELLRLSTQVVEAVVTGEDGVEAATVADPTRASALASAGTELLAGAADLRSGSTVTRVEVVLPEGGLFALGGSERRIVATTVPVPAAGLVAYDLRTALERIGSPPPQGSAPAGPAEEES